MLLPAASAARRLVPRLLASLSAARRRGRLSLAEAPVGLDFEAERGWLRANVWPRIERGTRRPTPPARTTSTMAGPPTWRRPWSSSWLSCYTCRLVPRPPAGPAEECIECGDRFCPRCLIGQRCFMCHAHPEGEPADVQVCVPARLLRRGTHPEILGEPAKTCNEQVRQGRAQQFRWIDARWLDKYETLRLRT